VADAIVAVRAAAMAIGRRWGGEHVAIFVELGWRSHT